MKKIIKNPFLKDSFIITIWNSLGKAMGFIVPILIAYIFGATEQTDAFFFAYSIIIFTSQIFSPVIEKIIIPFLTEKKEKKQIFAGQVFYLFLILSITITGSIILTTFILIPIFTRFSPNQIKQIHTILLEISPVGVLMALTSVLSGILNESRLFKYPAISPAFRSIINISIILILRKQLGIHSIAVGYTLGELIRFFYILSITLKHKLMSLKINTLPDRSFFTFLKTGFFHSLSLIFANIHPLIDKTMASWLNKGDVSHLQYAERLYSIPITFFTTGIFTVILSYWSKDYYTNMKKSNFLRKVNLTATLIFLITIFISGILISFRRQIISIIFDIGKKHSSSLNLIKISSVWGAYLLGLSFYMISQLFVYAHIVIKNTKSIMLCSLINIFLNITLNWILMKIYGLKGIALSTTLISVFSAIYLYKKLMTIKQNAQS